MPRLELVPRDFDAPARVRLGGPGESRELIEEQQEILSSSCLEASAPYQKLETGAGESLRYLNRLPCKV